MAPRDGIREARARGEHRPWLAASLALAGLALAAVVGAACASATAASARAPGGGSGAGATSEAAAGPRASTAEAPKSPVSIDFGATTLGWSTSPAIVAQEQGFFAAEGLTVELNITGQSAIVCQHLLARAVQIGNCSLNDTIQTVEASGAPLVLVMQEGVTALHNGLIAQSDVASYADLKSKTIMLGGPKDNTVYFFKTMARANGLRDDEYDVTYAGSSTARYAALQAGGVVGSLLTDPFDYRAEQEGFRRLNNLRPKYITAGNYAGNGPIVRRDWAQANGDTVERYVRAMLRTLGWINDPANQDATYAVLGPRLNLTPETFAHSYQRAVVDDREWSADGRAIPAAFEGVLQSLVELGVLEAPAPPASKYFDMTWVERVHARGLQ